MRTRFISRTFDSTSGCSEFPSRLCSTEINIGKVLCVFLFVKQSGTFTHVARRSLSIHKYFHTNENTYNRYKGDWSEGDRRGEREMNSPRNCINRNSNVN